MSALVKIIKNPFDTSIEENVIKVKAKTCLKDIQGVDPNNLVAYVNGEHVTNDYVLKNGDVCVIRQYPSAATTAALVTIGVVAVYGISDAITYGVSGKHIHEHAREGLINWLLPKSDGVTNQGRDKIETLPSISGSKNQSAFGKVVPLILGKTLFTPYLECKTAYNTISGEDGCDQMYNCLYLIGQKDLQIEDVSMGLEVLATNSGHVENGALTITSSKYPAADYGTQLELQCGENEVSIFPQKVVQENKTTELLNVNGTSEPFYAYSSRYAQKVELEFTFSGLVKYSSSGEKQDAETEITVEYSFDGGSTWQYGGDPSGDCKFDFSEATITTSYDSTTHKIKFKGQKTQTLRYVMTHTPDYSDMENCLAQTITYRIKRANAESQDSNTIDKIYLTAVRTWCYDAKASAEEEVFVAQAPMIERVRNKTTRLGFSIKVDKNVERDFDKINVIATSKARTFDGTGWSKTLSPTRNPAALALHCMIGDFRENYAYPISEGETYIECGEIDLDDFGEKYEICETTRNFGTEEEPHVDKLYYCDGVVLNPAKTVDLSNSILKCCRSYLVIKGKKYGIFMDKAQDYPLLVLNNNNLLSLSYTKNFDELPDGHRVKHVSAINFYQQNTFDVYPIGTKVTGDEKLVNVEYPFISDEYHAMAMSLYEQACLKLRPEVMNAKVTGEGGLAEIGSLIPVQSDVVTVGIGDGAEITELITSGTSITGIKTDGSFTVTDITKEYGVVINIVDSLGNEKMLKKKLASFSQTGTYSQFTFDTAAASDSGIEEGCIVSFGLYGQETIDMLCVGKNENEDSTYELTLVPYDENIYLADQEMIPDFDPKTTPPQESGLPINYGDPNPNITRQETLDLYSANAQRIAEVASNHIVTLYKYSETDLATTGIGTTLVYNFLNDTITWGDPSLNNGWSVTVPNDLTDVWVTSATAHGQSQTDTINSNEWARPIKVGQNGVNGLNTCTISLYKRLSSTPQDLPATVTYNFANASMVCSNWNGWSTSIPPIEEEDNDPCWEIHATALSTQTTDTIQPSEWSECVKILSEGLSKQEVLDLIGERINETPNVMFTPSEGMFAVDEDGIVSTPQIAFMDVRVIQNDEDIAFSFGQIDLPTGMTVSATVLDQGTRLNFTVAQGTRLERNVIKVPVIFTAYADNDVLVDENGNPLVWVEDEDGRWYGDCSSVASLPSAVSGGFIYWKGIDTTASEELVEGGVFYEGTFYTYNGTKWKESEIVPLGIQTQASNPTTYDVYYTASIVKGGRYDGGITTVASIPANPVIGDYFTWTGTDQTPYEGSGFTKLASGCVYKWNGTAWEKDTSGKHLGTALPDILEVAESELVENNSDVVEKVGKMIAWDVVTQNIKVTGEALINSAIIADLTLGDSSHPNSGSFKSWNYVQGSDGFKLNPNGTAELNDVIIRGTVYASAGSFSGAITATSLTLGNGVSVPSNKVTGLADVATSGSYDDLEDLPSLFSGSYDDLTDKPTYATGTTVTHSTVTESGVKKERVTVTTTDSDGNTTSSNCDVVRTDEYVYLGNSYGSQSQQHNTKYTKISADGLLEADNAIIYGTVYATNGSFTGNVIANSFTLGANAGIEKGTDSTGNSYFGLSSDGTLKVRNINAIDGQFTGTVHATNGEFEGSIINDSLSVSKFESGTKLLMYGTEQSSMSYGKISYLFCKMFNLPLQNNTPYNYDITLTNKTVYIFNEDKGIDDYIDRFKLKICTSHAGRPATWDDEYCLLQVHTVSGNWVDLLSAYDPNSSIYGWENIILIGITILNFYDIVSNGAKIKYGLIPYEESTEDGVLYDDNGFIKISGKNQPWKYFEFASGTDEKYVYDTLKPWIATGYNISCIGYYGASDSSHNRSISSINAVGGNLNFVNINDTNYLSISANQEYGQALLTGKLALLFLSV